MNQAMADTLDKIDKLPPGESIYACDNPTNLVTDELKTLSTHLRKLMQVDENARQIYNGEVDPRAED